MEAAWDPVNDLVIRAVFRVYPLDIKKLATDPPHAAEWLACGQSMRAIP